MCFAFEIHVIFLSGSAGLAPEVRRLGHRSRNRDLSNFFLGTKDKLLQTFLCKTMFIPLVYLEDC